MKTWYAAHLILYVEKKTKSQRRFPVWENIVLIQANSEEEAIAKAEKRGREEEGDDDGSFRWGNTPARWVFAGVRRLIRCEDEERRPGDGTEVTYNEMEFASREKIERYAQGQAVSAEFLEEVGPPVPKPNMAPTKTSAVNGVRTRPPRP